MKTKAEVENEITSVYSELNKIGKRREYETQSDRNDDSQRIASLAARLKTLRWFLSV